MFIVVKLAIDDLHQDDIDNLQAMVVMRKSTLTRLIGANAKPNEGFHNKKLYVSIYTCNLSPTLYQQ